MSLDPDDISKSKCIFQSREKGWDGTKVSRLKPIDESVADRTFHIGFSNTLIGHCETSSHKGLMESCIFAPQSGNIFFCENIDFSS